MKKVYRNPYNLYLGFLLMVNLLPFLAPILMHLATYLPVLEIPARLIYLIYSFTCHQFHHRSLHIYDYQAAWCIRDMGIWGGILLISYLVKRFHVYGVKWYWVLPFIIPIALDGGIQTIATMLGVPMVGPTGDPVYISNNLVRFLTGSIFGVGLALWISPLMYQIFIEEMPQVYRDQITKLKTTAKKLWPKQSAPLAIGLLLVFYTAFVQLWWVTSPQYPPTDILDTAVKTPVSDFYVRRLHGICPTSSEDLFAVDCFFE